MRISDWSFRRVLFRSARAIATAGVIIGTGQVSAIDLQAEAGVEWLPCERCVHDVEPLLPEAIVRFPEDMRLITIGRIELEQTQLRLQRIVYTKGVGALRSLRTTQASQDDGEYGKGAVRERGGRAGMNR